MGIIFAISVWNEVLLSRLCVYYKNKGTMLNHFFLPSLSLQLTHFPVIITRHAVTSDIAVLERVNAEHKTRCASITGYIAALNIYIYIKREKNKLCITRARRQFIHLRIQKSVDLIQ